MTEKTVVVSVRTSKVIHKELKLAAVERGLDVGDLYGLGALLVLRRMKGEDAAIGSPVPGQEPSPPPPEIGTIRGPQPRL